jgi:hypothetical protein
MYFKKKNWREVPEWLSSIKLSEDMNLNDHEFPLDFILNESVYYPACSFDMNPIRYLGGFTHSFIYVDYLVERQSLPELGSQSFLPGYRLCARRNLRQEELTPHGWSEKLNGIDKSEFEQDFLKLEKMRHWFIEKEFFAEWLIFEKTPERIPEWDKRFGPERISMLYICADGVATYQALYATKNIAPLVLCIIQPGHCFGGNWTNFTDPKGLFARLVMSQAAVPEYIICGGMLFNYDKAFWSAEYPTGIETYRETAEYGSGMWKRRKSPIMDFSRNIGRST